MLINPVSSPDFHGFAAAAALELDSFFSLSSAFFITASARNVSQSAHAYGVVTVSGFHDGSPGT